MKLQRHKIIVIRNVSSVFWALCLVSFVAIGGVKLRQPLDSTIWVSTARLMEGIMVIGFVTFLVALSAQIVVSLQGRISSKS